MKIWSTLNNLIKIEIEIKRLFNKSFNLILLVLLVVLLFNVLFNYNEIRNKFIKPSIAVVVEDDSLEVNMLVDSITSKSMGDKLSFEHLSLDIALSKLKENKILAIIHIEEGLGETINRAEPVIINLFVTKDKDVRVKFLREYIENLTNMLNEGQNGAMIYYQLLKKHELPYEDRIDELNKLAFKYTSVFLGRQLVFEKEEPIEPFLGAKFIEYYLVTIELLFIVYTIIMYYYILEDDLKYKRIERLTLSGYSISNILISKLIAGWIFTLPVILIIQSLSAFIMKEFIISIFLKKLIILTVFHLCIQLWIILAHFTIKKHNLRDIAMLLTPIILSVLGGLFVPLNGLLSIFKISKYLNVFTIVQENILGVSSEEFGYFILLIMILLPLYGIYKVSKERNYVFF